MTDCPELRCDDAQPRSRRARPAYPKTEVLRGSPKPTSPLKVPYADRDGELVHASQVSRGLACGCACIECGARLVARIGQKTRPHFAHHASDWPCDGESLLHRLGKRILAQRIEGAIATQRSVNVLWGCERCCRNHETDLVQGATGVAVEHTIRTAAGAIRPDVVVFGPSGEPQTLIEVIVTHEPEQPVYDYAQVNGIAVAEFRIATVADLEALDHTRTLQPGKATLGCLTPSCSECGDPVQGKPTRYSLHVVTASCWKCGTDMMMALWESEAGELHDSLGGYAFGPSGLICGISVEDGEGPGEDELSVARSHGAVIGRQYSRTMSGYYQANTCARCGAFVGANFEGDYADRIDPSNRVSRYSRCEHCRCGTCDCTGLPAPQSPTGPATGMGVMGPARRSDIARRIKCGHCKTHHATVGEVRRCSDGS